MAHFVIYIHTNCTLNNYYLQKNCFSICCCLLCTCCEPSSCKMRARFMVYQIYLSATALSSVEMMLDAIFDEAQDKKKFSLTGKNMHSYNFNYWWSKPAFPANMQFSHQFFRFHHTNNKHIDIDIKSCPKTKPI